MNRGAAVPTGSRAGPDPIGATGPGLGSAPGSPATARGRRSGFGPAERRSRSPARPPATSSDRAEVRGPWVTSGENPAALPGPSASKDAPSPGDSSDVPGPEPCDGLMGGDAVRR